MQQLERRESTRVRSGVILSSQTRPLSHLFWFCQVSQSMSSHVHLGFVINPAGHIGLTSRDRTQPCGKHSAVWFSCWKLVVYFSNWLKKMWGKKNQKTFGVIQSIRPAATSYVLHFSAGVLLLCPIDLRQRVQIAGGGGGGISAPSPCICLERRPRRSWLTLVPSEQKQMENNRFFCRASFPFSKLEC